MKKYLLTLMLCFLALWSQQVHSQDKKPKVALVLSGGGAKGMAHIATLQLLDSLGIVPDLVVGTSMGSIIGGFYAMGYSGDSIAAIAKTADWVNIFGGTINLDKVGNEEKSGFNQYLVDFDIIKGAPKPKGSIYNDQNLNEFFGKYTYPVCTINNFDELPIPFRAVATDIINGKEVVIDHGSVGFAMRASLSVPTLFLPVKYQGTMLVDGSVLNNFPTDVARNLGADIIIGSDVGGGMEPEEKLDNMISVLIQTGMLASNLKNEGNKEICDILVDHVPHITYTSSDLTKARKIYAQGKIELNVCKFNFVELAEQLKKYPQRVHKIPRDASEITIDSIAYKGISRDNRGLTKARMDLQPHKKYKADELVNALSRAMGTNIFDQITYNTFQDEETFGLQFNGVEKTKNKIHGSIHYDDYRDIGILVNYIGRNVIGNASRMQITLDIAKQPRYRFQYQKNFGKAYKYWTRSEAYGQFLEQEAYLEGETLEDLNYDYYLFDSQINKNFNSLKDFAGIGISYEYTTAEPKKNPEIDNNALDLRDYRFKNLELYGHYNYNSMNQVRYATRGTFFQARLARSLYHEADVSFVEQTTNDVSDQTNGFTRLGMGFEKRVSLSKNFVAAGGAEAGFIFMDDPGEDDVSFAEYGYGANYQLGGNLIRPRKDDVVFPGLNEGELPVTQFVVLKGALQYSPGKNFYLTPHVHLASVGYNDFSDFIEHAFSPNGDWYLNNEVSALISAGITASYNSFLGPVDVDVSWVNGIDKVRLFFGIGYQFNRSN